MSRRELLAGKYLGLLTWLLIPAATLIPFQIALAVMGRVPAWQWALWGLGIAALAFTPSSIGLLCSTVFRSTLAARTISFGSVFALTLGAALACLYVLYRFPSADLYQLLVPLFALWILMGALSWAGAVRFIEHEPE
jgi:ABC-type transport system involved in multi-copper enzyme maturation permease subunit